jgi:hypothetical protein
LIAEAKSDGALGGAKVFSAAMEALAARPEVVFWQGREVLGWYLGSGDGAKVLLPVSCRSMISAAEAGMSGLRLIPSGSLMAHPAAGLAPGRQCSGKVSSFDW